MSSGNTLQIPNLKAFDGNNYSNWEFRLKLILEQHNVLEVLETVETSDTFKKMGIKARSIIVQGLEDNILNVIKDKKTAKEMVDTLRSTYVKSGLSVQVDLQRKLRNMRYTKGSLSQFLTEFEKTVTELRSSGGKLNDDEIVSQLLATMPETFQLVTTAINVIFSQDSSKITFEFVKNKLLQEEARQEVTNLASTSNSVACVGNKGKRYFKKNISKPTNASGSQSESNFKFRCYRCGKFGHKRSDCVDTRESYRKANVAEEQEEEVSFMVSDSKYVDELRSDSIITFIVDSGATNHMVNKNTGQYLVEQSNVDYVINVAKKGVAVTAKICGTLYVESMKGRKLKIERVLQCDDLEHNLLSVMQIEKEGFKIIFENNKVKILNKHLDTLVEGNLCGNLYVVSFKLRPHTANVVCDDRDILHRRMGHSSIFPSKTLCDVCVKGKQTRTIFESILEHKKARRLLEVVSSDVAGPITPPTNNGMKYYVTFTDHFSHFSYVYFIKTKNEVFEKFKEYEALVTAKFSSKISKFRCDNGGEYSSKEFRLLCLKQGIQIQYNVPRNPEQNGVSERYNCTLLNMARCLLIDSTLPKTFWGEAVRTAAYIINRLPSSALQEQVTPAEVWYQHKISINNIKVFGCVGHVHVPKEDRGTLDVRSKPMLMVGYAPNGYRLWDPSKDEIVTAKSVVFNEKEKQQDITDIHKNIVILEDMDKDRIAAENEKEVGTEPEEIQKDDLKRSTRNKKLPVYLQDYEIDLMTALSIECYSSGAPESYEEAIEDITWKEAIKEELQAHEKNNTWVK